MDRINPRLPIILSLVIIIIMSLTCCKSEEDLYTRIMDFCKIHDEVNLSEITSFDWDIAYVDRQYYNNGKEIKEKYHIEGEFQVLETDFSSRVAFCKDGNLVHDLVLNNFYFEFDADIEIIMPNSVFTVTWSSMPNQQDKLFLLTQKQILLPPREWFC